MKYKTYIVESLKKESSDTVTISLENEREGIPYYIPGQYINIYFHEVGFDKGKPYSISSAPSENKLSITVKRIGEFSNKLCNLKPGDKVVSSLPSGGFYPELEDRNLVLIASGIGITPFRSIIIEIFNRNRLRHVTLFHSTRYLKETIFFEEFKKIESVTNKFSSFYYVTRERNLTIKNVYNRRIKIEDVFPKINPEDTEILICGSIAFVRHIWRNLVRTGISEERINTEVI
jgi:ferredoxin-NADP reductase